ncbi:MAG: prepilin peptidase [Lentisphaerae bacterium]|nr:prepilin peptidase [Lentisphaerota bacterium]
MFSEYFPWYPFFTFLSFFWGAAIGSFLNVCIYRIPRDESVVAPRSHCPHCSKLIPWYLNIPIFSYLMLCGRCRFCKARITPRYVLVELLVALLFLLVWLKFDLLMGARPLGLLPIVSPALVPVYWLFVSGLVLATFVDLEHYIIPDSVSIGGMVAGLILSALVPAMHGVETVLESLIQSVIGLAMGFGLLWSIGKLGSVIFRKPAMGFGDVKLIGAMGAFLGWQAVLFTIIGSSLVGSVIGISLVVGRCKRMQSRLPYGPYLALAAILWIFWGQNWWQLYIDFLTRPVY